jgi:hypothetical protein
VGDKRRRAKVGLGQRLAHIDIREREQLPVLKRLYDEAVDDAPAGARREDAHMAQTMEVQ